MSYQNSKIMLNKLRDDYGCKGEILFRTAIQYVVECGQQHFQDIEWVNEQLDIVDKKHDAFDRENKTSFISRDFEKVIIECAWEIAKVPVMDMLQYVQKEVWLSGDGIDYQRAISLLTKCMDWIEDEFDKSETLDTFQYLGFEDDELYELGFGYLIEEDEE